MKGLVEKETAHGAAGRTGGDPISKTSSVRGSHYHRLAKDRVNLRVLSSSPRS